MSNTFWSRHHCTCPFWAVLICCSLAIARAADRKPRIVNPVDEQQLIVLKGNTNPSAKLMHDDGQVSQELPMTDLVLVLGRSPEQQAAFDAFIASQYDPKSPNFHRWLQPEEVGEEFGPATEDIEAVSAWLRKHSLAVADVAKNRLSIRFSGKASDVENAFHTQIHNLELMGVQHIGNTSDPQIPAAIAPVVIGVKALHNFFPRPMHRLGHSVAQNHNSGAWERISHENTASAKSDIKPLPGTSLPQFGTTNSSADRVEDVAPYDFATIYSVLPLWIANSPIDGTGQLIAIAGTSDINSNDVTTFRNFFGLPPHETFTTIIANGADPGQCTGAAGTSGCNIDDLIENTLDVEWSGAIAPAASIVLVVSGSTSVTTDPVYLSANYAIENRTGQILSVSYGQCELGEGTTGNIAYYDLWQTAAAEGITVVVAAGDSGSAACDDGMSAVYGTPYAAEYGLSVNGMASTPYSVTVGGTDFNWCPSSAINSSSTCTASPYWNTSNAVRTYVNARGYVPEIPWNDSCASPTGIASAQYWTKQLNLTGYSLPIPTDAETACNFFLDESVNIYNVSNGYDASAYVDTVGGGGGASGCVASVGQFVSSCVGSTAAVGGGSITLFNDGWPKPAWQTGVSGIPSDGVRDIPDVSFFAGDGLNDSAYLICVSANGDSCTYTGDSDGLPLLAQEVGGTSVATAAMAGVMALISQQAGGAVGIPNAELYTMAGKQNYSSCSSETATAGSTCFFNDIDLYSNAQPCDYGRFGYMSPNCTATESYNGSGDSIGILSGGSSSEGGYNAGPGYDLTTGLGSLNVANIVNGWSSTNSLPALSLSPDGLTFGGSPVGTASISQSISLTNSGGAPLNFAAGGSGLAIVGTNADSFSQTNSCGLSIAAGASCSIVVTMKPTKTGTLVAELALADNAYGSPQFVSLSGSGTNSELSLSPASLTFPNTFIGKSSALQIAVNNGGNAPLDFGDTTQGISIVGPDGSSYSETNNCGSVLVAGGSCVITVTFAPAAAGEMTAALQIGENSNGGQQTVSLSGTGVLIPSIIVTSMQLASVKALSATPLIATLSASVITASGTAKVNEGSILFKVFNGQTLLGVAVTSKTVTNGSVSVMYPLPSGTPAGTYTIQAMYSDNGSIYASCNSTASLTVVVANPGFSLTFQNPSISAQSGQSAQNQITITPSNGFAGTVSFACSGLPSNSSCIFSPATLTFTKTLDSPQVTSLTINTAPPTSSTRSGTSLFFPDATLAAFLCLVTPKWRQRRKFLMLLVILVAAVNQITGCAAIHLLKAQGDQVTSVVTVTATSGSLQETAEFSFTGL